MSNKLEKKVKENQEIAEANIIGTVKQSALTEGALTAAMMLGAVKTVNHMNAYFAAQTIRGLQKIRDEKHFESFGFTRFDDFLDDYIHSPMTYKQFKDRENALIAEGDEVFDVLNSLNFSIRKRRLLGAGNVTIEDGKMVVKRTDENGDEYTEEIEISDQQKLIQTLSALADQNVKLQTKVDKQKKQIERRDNDIEDLIEKNKSGKITADSALFELFVIAKQALAQLAEHIEKDVTDAEKKRSGEIYLGELFGEFSKVRQNLGRSDLRFDSPVETDGEFSAITQKINDDDLAALID